MTTLYALGAVTIGGYRLRTGDNTSDGGSVTGALVEAEAVLDEYLNRQLALEERTESVIIHRDMRVYPTAWPITHCDAFNIDGRALVYAKPDLGPFVGLFASDYDWDGTPLTPRMTVTYTGGFDDGTHSAPLPPSLAHAIYDLARGALFDALVPAGYQSASVGDVSAVAVPGGTEGIDGLVPGLWSRIKKYRNRYL